MPDDENLEQPHAHPHVPSEMVSTTLTGTPQRDFIKSTLLLEICSEEARREVARAWLATLAAAGASEMHRQCGIEDLTALEELRSAFQRQQSNYTRLYHAVIGGECTTCDEKDICAIATSHRELAEKVEAERDEWRKCAGRLAESLAGNALEPLWKALEQFHKLTKEAK